MNVHLRMLAVAGFVTLSDAAASAHPGHGEPGPLHYVTDANHVVPVVMVTALILGGLYALASLRKSRGQA
ncbi:hypothetical protein K227x_45880 [Rubripirellula lacrimiformis]|uniref:Uncharacterized protein n=1 Tax=Rubripirellula lacrimiformis TaxID=1930273 RepID=A0A517NGC8_9BACT|nr:hypothetical protein [Rubripirellula lacrimiformis]QDT06180.1 hypothetical protein K227x_45880 [Rubripirellula lacrimiformis]